MKFSINFGNNIFAAPLFVQGAITTALVCLDLFFAAALTHAQWVFVERINEALVYLFPNYIFIMTCQVLKAHHHKFIAFLAILALAPTAYFIGSLLSKVSDRFGFVFAVSLYGAISFISPPVLVYFFLPLFY